MSASTPPSPIAATADLRVVRPGVVGYADALAWQRTAAKQVRDGSEPETLFLLQHAPVITLGRRARTDANLRWSRDELAERGVEVTETDRGGDVTFHGPGQLVGYPILDLRLRKLGPHTYLRFLEGLLIDVLATYGVAGFRDPDHTGVWTERGKIAAMGIRVSAGVSLHGFALNVNTDLSFFDLIVPCGIQGRSVTSMEDHVGEPLDIAELMDRVEEAFRAAPLPETVQ